MSAEIVNNDPCNMIIVLSHHQTTNKIKKALSVMLFSPK
jgi:hypothetical protein